MGKKPRRLKLKKVTLRKLNSDQLGNVAGGRRLGGGGGVLTGACETQVCDGISYGADCSNSCNTCQDWCQDYVTRICEP